MISLKNSDALEKMRRAGMISANALKLAGELVKPGVTTEYINAEVEAYIRKEGAVPSFYKYNGYPASCCISINNVVIHGIPSAKTVIKEGDIVSVDVGASIDGYHGDNAYTFSAGKISDEAQRLLDVTRQSLYDGISKAVVGNRLGDISSAIQTTVEAAGYDVVRDFVGHGIGRKMHEDPEVPNYGRAGRGVRLFPGMVLAIEPMVNEKGVGVRVLDDEWTVITESGSLSAHFEHTVAITESGPVILTQPSR